MAAFALGLAGDRGAVDRLLAALADADTGVRARAAEALGRIGDPRAAPAIARFVVDALPKTISRMTVRGDDPGNADDTWAEQRLALFALARLRDVPAGRARAPRRRPAPVRLVGGDLDGDAPREPGAAAGARRRPRLRRPPLARPRRPRPRGPRGRVRGRPPPAPRP